MADTIPGALAPLPIRRAELRDGVSAVRDTIAAIGDISERTFDRFGPDTDGRDYPLICAAVDLLMRRALHASPSFREGACRALADLLTQTADEWTDADALAEWNPLAVTRTAFAAQRGTRGDQRV